MKKVMEIRRGDPVPDGSKWLKDKEKIVGSRTVPSDHPYGGYDTEDEYAMFDVYEVPLTNPDNAREAR